APSRGHDREGRPRDDLHQRPPPARRLAPAARGRWLPRRARARVAGARQPSVAAPAALPARTSPRAVTREVKLSSADRVLFPDDGVTKGDLFEYYRDVAPALVPHLRDRPFTMKRFREGISGPGFFQKQAPKGMPPWIPTRRYRTFRREGGSRLVDFPLVNSTEALLWMVQMHCIDMNAWYSRVDRPDRPDFVLFDLDPPDEAFSDSVEVALLIREGLRELGLDGWVKTSGAGGMHILVPIARRSGYDDTYEFAERLSRLLEERHPGVLT